MGFTFGTGGMGGMGGFGGGGKKDKDVNLFSLSKEDRARQRELLDRQQRSSTIQIMVLGGCLLLVLVMYFAFGSMHATPPAKAHAAANHGTDDGSPDSAIATGRLLDQLKAPDVRPSPEEMAPQFDPLQTLDPKALAAGIGESNLTAADAYTRNKPTPAAVALALRYLRTHLEQDKDFKDAPGGVALPFYAVQHPDAARGRFQTIEGVIQESEPEFYRFVKIDDPALQKATGVKELHLFYFDMDSTDRVRFYFGKDIEPPEAVEGCGLPAKLYKFAVLTPTDLSPIEEANIPPTDEDHHPMAHMIFNLRMHAIFLGDHLVLPVKLKDPKKRVVVPLYLAIDPMPWRTDVDKPATLGPKVDGMLARTVPSKGGAADAHPADGTTPAAGSTPAGTPGTTGTTGTAAAGNGSAPTANSTDDDGSDATATAIATGKAPGDQFVPMSPHFTPLKTLTGQEDAFASIPTDSDLDSTIQASKYTESFEAFDLVMRFLRTHNTPAELEAYRQQRETANVAQLKDPTKAAANFTNTVNNPLPYYGQPYQVEGWMVKCLSARDYWSQDFGPGTGAKAQSGVEHTSTWIVRDDNVNFYLVTVPLTDTQVLGKDFKGDLNDLTGLNMRVRFDGLFLQRVPIEKKNFQYDLLPMYVAMKLQKVIIPPSSVKDYTYFVAAGMGLVFFIMLYMIYRDRKPDAVVRDVTRQNMFKRLRKAGKLTKPLPTGAGAGTGAGTSATAGAGPGDPPTVPNPYAMPSAPAQPPAGAPAAPAAPLAP
ncbi:MAG: hypothetical protein ACREJ2_17670, partial [Planctomycetota bacterium]